MVLVNPRQVHHVPKVPTHERIHVRDGRHRDVLGIGQHVRLEDTLSEVAPSEFVGRGGQPDDLDAAMGNHRKHSADSERGRFQFPERQLRKDEPQIATNECVHESPRMNAKLFVLAATDDRRVRVDSTNHGLILRLPRDHDLTASARRISIEMISAG